MKFRLWLLLLCLLTTGFGRGLTAQESPSYESSKNGDAAPVIHAGRAKPLEVAAREILLGITGKPHLPKQSGLDWSPAEAVTRFTVNGADYRHVLLIPLAYGPAQEKLGLIRDPNGPQVLWLSVATAAVYAPAFQGLYLRQENAKSAQRVDPLSATDQAILECGLRWFAAETLLAGRSFQVLPVVYDKETLAWLKHRTVIPPRWSETLGKAPINEQKFLELWLFPEEILAPMNPEQPLTGWPGQAHGEVARQWLKRYEQHQSHDGISAAYAQTFFSCAASRAVIQQQVSHVSDTVPTPERIAVEMFYYQALPFTWAWIAAALAVVACAMAWRRGAGPVWIKLAMGLLTVAVLAGAFGLTLRGYISGTGAVTNLYETLVYVGAAVGLMGLMFGRKGSVLFISGGAIGALLCGLIGDAIPAEQGRDLAPLMPVLKSSFWLFTHVKIIVASYAAFLLAWAVGNVVLVQAWREQRGVRHSEALACYRCIQVGLVLLILGTLLGAIWAADSWGRFWGWDPKEVFALVAILVYLIPLHLRYVGHVGPRGMIAWSILGFLSVVMSWYGVNFLLGAGLHAYAFGSGGQIPVLTLCALQMIWVMVILPKIPAVPGEEPATTR